MLSSYFSYLMLVFCLAAVLDFGFGQEYTCDPTPNGLSDNCIGCICEASTGCKQSTACIQGGSFCGPFLITRNFWVDAGSCTLPGEDPNDPLSWQRCAKDLVCAANTIRSYVNRFGKDCNGDEFVTCEDYVMIHKNGGWNCGNSLEGSEFWNVFQKCKKTVLSNGFNI